jgi:hypothetical protein
MPPAYRKPATRRHRRFATAADATRNDTRTLVAPVVCLFVLFVCEYMCVVNVHNDKKIYFCKDSIGCMFAHFCGQRRQCCTAQRKRIGFLLKY